MFPPPSRLTNRLIKGIRFSRFAANYTSEQWQKDLVNKVTAFIQTHINWIGVNFIDPTTTFETSSPANVKGAVRVLDYACGPGTVTRALGSRATEYVGMDLSENMVQAYNLRFNPAAATSSTGEEREDETLNAHAVVGNLIAEQEPPASLSTEEYRNFDLVVVGLGFHHFANIPLATQRLVDRLRPGGIFMIIDFVTHPAEPDVAKHPSAHTVAHNGFSEKEMKRIFEGAGLVDFGHVAMGEEVTLRGTMKREPFIARGRKE
ncbi:uncharacterized protein Z518_01322 [Rhinocladiella mackenziei CBS 650.93]|uniref:Methyltransferase domain-containing protein n=1 Tax=Rhinocladiella mackenziei CBS 650.93 TaxID=1442369 RepID=A0A0D2J3E9_9EURO|nr:uncharacterized protein Z518_01322 [Rhinocladiella mackenziei CBS 650.93]KIX10241.1 hypothetical protein Z518_01322 [Rhinocladiella mackenziei CBS 650.93]